MKAYTAAEAIALGYGVPADLEEYYDVFGEDLRASYIQTYVQFAYNSYYVANVFNYTLWGFVGAFVLFSMFSHHALPALTARSKRLESVRTFLVKHLYLSATLGKRALEPHGYKFASFQIPERVHGIACFIYVAANIIIVLTPYMVLTPNAFYQDIGYPWDQLSRGFADRTGIMAFGSTPLIILLSGRNNPLMWLTGASYSTLQLYHRWVARVTWMHAVFHSAAYSLIEAMYAKQYFIEAFQEAYWNWGVAATTGGALLCVASMRGLREKAYETFLVLHIVGAIVWIAGCYYHVYLIEFREFYGWIYASMALWAFDRFLRGVRVFWLNSPRLNRNKNPAGAVPNLAAEGYIVSDEHADFVRLRVTPSGTWPQRWGGPGSYVFITSPGLDFWQSHPFTITWPTGMPQGSALLEGLPTSSSSSSSAAERGEKRDTASHDFASFAHQSPNSFELVLKSYSGFTKSLAAKLKPSTEAADAGQPGKVHPIRLIVDGPYGSDDTLRRFDNVLLVAGGSGISAAIAHIADLYKAYSADQLKVKHVDLVWAVRDHKTCPVLVPYLTELQKLFGNHGDGFLSVHIHYTGQTSILSTQDEAKVTSDKASDSSTETLRQIEYMFGDLVPFVQLHTSHGRPDVLAHVDSVLPPDPETLAVCVCGPAGLCDVTREAVKARTGGKSGKSARHLAYFQEAFNW